MRSIARIYLSFLFLRFFREYGNFRFVYLFIFISFFSRINFLFQIQINFWGRGRNIVEMRINWRIVVVVAKWSHSLEKFHYASKGGEFFLKEREREEGNISLNIRELIKSSMRCKI